jgi:hypothetical protein
LEGFGSVKTTQSIEVFPLSIPFTEIVRANARPSSNIHSILNTSNSGNANRALVQFLLRFPTIFAGFMGDTPTGRPVVDGNFQNSAQRSSTSSFDESEGPKAYQGGPHASSSQGNYPHAQSVQMQQHGSQSRQEHLNMASLATALPDMSYLNYSNVSPQRYASGPSPSQHLYHLQSMPQLNGPINQSATNLPYNVQYQAPYQGMYVPGQSPPTVNSQSGLNIGNQFYQGQPFMGQAPVSPYFIQPGQYGPQGQMYTANPSMGQYGSRGSFTGDNRPLPQQRSGEYQPGTLIDGMQRRPSSIGKGIIKPIYTRSRPGLTNYVASSTSPSSVVRGPPRKPRQSGKLFFFVMFLFNMTDSLHFRPCHLDWQSATADRFNEPCSARLQGNFRARIPFFDLEEQLRFRKF